MMPGVFVIIVADDLSTSLMPSRAREVCPDLARVGTNRYFLRLDCEGLVALRLVGLGAVAPFGNGDSMTILSTT